MAHALRLMQWMGHMVSESALLDDPLAVSCSKGGQTREQNEDQHFAIHKVCLELHRNREQSSAKRPSRDNGHWVVRRRDAMNLFAVVFLIESNNAQDRRQYHSGAVYPGHRLVKFYRTALFGSGYPGRTDCIVRCDAIQIS